MRTSSTPAQQPAPQATQKPKPTFRQALRAALPTALGFGLVSFGVSLYMKPPWAASRADQQETAYRAGRYASTSAMFAELARSCRGVEAVTFTSPDGKESAEWRGAADVRWLEEQAAAYRKAAEEVSRSATAPGDLRAAIREYFAPRGMADRLAVDQKRVIERRAEELGGLDAACTFVRLDAEAIAADLPLPAGTSAARH